MNSSVGFTACALNGLPTGMQAQSWKDCSSAFHWCEGAIRVFWSNLSAPDCWTAAAPRTPKEFLGVQGVQTCNRCGRGCWPWWSLVFRLEAVENLGAILLFRTAPIQRLCAMPMCHWREASKQNEVSRQYFSRPTRLCPAGCQANILLIQRCPGNVAKYCATFQSCRKQNSDHVLDAACQANTRTRSFQMWRTSCHGNVQSMLRGGPTTDRRSRRYATSILCRSLRYTVLCPAAKHAMGETTLSKYSIFWAIESFGSQRIHLFALNAFAAAWSRHSTSHVVVCTVDVVNMHPSHLWLDSLSRTDMVNPFGVCSCDGGWACLVRVCVFCAFNCNPTAARFSTSLSKSTPMTW